MKLSKKQILQNELKEWFDSMDTHKAYRVVWCKEKDGSGFSEKQTAKLHTALEVINYSSIPEMFNGGYVVHYKQLNKNLKFYADPWTGEAVIDPKNLMFNLTEKEMILLHYAVKVDGCNKPKRSRGLKMIVNHILNEDVDELKTEFSELSLVEQAKYQESIYFQEKPLNLSPRGEPVTPAYPQQNKKVTDTDILRFLYTNYNYTSVDINVLIISIGGERILVLDKLHSLVEYGWVDMTLTEQATSGLVSLTSSGRKTAKGEVESNQRVVQIKFSRLNTLKQKEAMMGIDTPAYILLEITNLEKELGL